MKYLNNIIQGDCLEILQELPNENMIVLDPFMGSGSTAIACLNLNRHYIGIEKEQKYIDKIKIRIAESKSKIMDYNKNQDNYNQLA